MARLDDSVHTKLQPTPSERMLIFPPVAKAQFLLGARWALSTWLSAVLFLRRQVEERHESRVSVQARRVAAGARRCRWLLGVYSGFWQWHETVGERKWEGSAPAGE